MPKIRTFDLGFRFPRYRRSNVCQKTENRSVNVRLTTSISCPKNKRGKEAIENQHRARQQKNRLNQPPNQEAEGQRLVKVMDVPEVEKELEDQGKKESFPGE